MRQDFQDLTIVWVEMGRKLPNYARNNFRLLRRTHPQLRQILFTDNEVDSLDIEVVSRYSIPKSDFTVEFERKRKNWPFKQEYFWQGTTSRFFHIHDLVLSLDIQSLLHLETDSVLLDPSPFASIKGEKDISLAYPLQADGIGCASILWARDANSLRPFLEFVLENWDKEQCDDMSLLGKYSNSQGVLQLPTWTDSNRFEGHLFDAQSVGRYFLGTDARNMRTPFSHRGIKDYRRGSITEYLESSSCSWSIDIEEKRISVKGSYAGTKFQMVNLHIHSKFIPSSVAGMTRFLKKSFGSSRGAGWRLGKFDRNVFRERFYSFAKRRILQSQEDTEKIFR